MEFHYHRKLPECVYNQNQWVDDSVCGSVMTRIFSQPVAIYPPTSMCANPTSPFTIFHLYSTRDEPSAGARWLTSALSQWISDFCPNENKDQRFNEQQMASHSKKGYAMTLYTPLYTYIPSHPRAKSIFYITYSTH